VRTNASCFGAHLLGLVGIVEDEFPALGLAISKNEDVAGFFVKDGLLVLMKRNMSSRFGESQI
jgi:hypothetical protein